MRSLVLRILTYHRVVGPGEASDPSVVSATPDVFDRQMRYLSTRYRPVSAEAVLDAVRGRRALPDRAVLVTFDDAYADFGVAAWPILRRHGVPATVFVATAYPDEPDREFWWDRLYRAFAVARCPRVHVPGLGELPLGSPESRHASARSVQAHLKQIPHAAAVPLAERLIDEAAPDPRPAPEVLGWEDLRALAAEGVAVCPHTRHHPALDQLPVEEARAEIVASREDLRRELGETLPIFAYPFGNHSQAVVDVVRDAGFEVAVTCRSGHNPLPVADPLRLRRTNITPRTSPLVFRLRLHRAFGPLDRWRHRSRAA